MHTSCYIFVSYERANISISNACHNASGSIAESTKLRPRLRTVPQSATPLLDDEKKKRRRLVNQRYHRKRKLLQTGKSTKAISSKPPEQDESSLQTSDDVEKNDTKVPDNELNELDANQPSTGCATTHAIGVSSAPGSQPAKVRPKPIAAHDPSNAKPPTR